MNAELRGPRALPRHGGLLRRRQGGGAEGDLDFRDLEDSYGIGMRIIGLKGYAFRVEVAHSREHAARLLVSAGGAF